MDSRDKQIVLDTLLQLQQESEGGVREVVISIQEIPQFEEPGHLQQQDAACPSVEVDGEDLLPKSQDLQEPIGLDQGMIFVVFKIILGQIFSIFMIDFRYRYLYLFRPKLFLVVLCYRY